MNHRLLAPVLALALAASPALHADEIADSMEAAAAAYRAGRFSEAIQSLDYAGQLIRQKKSEALIKVFPAAPRGWEASEAESQAAATAMFGGMTSAKREYTKGSATVTLEVQADSAVLQSVVMVMSNPMLLTSSGAKLETIKGQRAAVTYRGEDKSGDVKLVVDNRYLVSVTGNEVSREELVQFTGLIDYAALRAVQ